jgi:hypothetical protein
MKSGGSLKSFGPLRTFRIVLASSSSPELTTALHEFLTASPGGCLSDPKFDLEIARLGHLKSTLETFFDARAAAGALGFPAGHCADGAYQCFMDGPSQSVHLFCRIRGTEIDFGITGTGDFVMPLLNGPWGGRRRSAVCGGGVRAPRGRVI